jgi:hypothetical protein
MIERFKPGDILDNGYATGGNPTRTGIVVSIGHRTGRINPGGYYRMTDLAGSTWEISFSHDRLTKVGQLPPIEQMPRKEP